MSEYLLLGDIHLSDRAPSSCTDSYLDDIFTLLVNAHAMAGERGCEAIIWAGDVFHHKTPSRTTHKTVHRLIDLAAAAPCPVYCVPGNHDMLNDRFDSLDETQPLGVVLASGAVRLLRGWSGVDTGDLTAPVYGVPWLMRFDDDMVSDALDDWRTHTGAEHHGLVVTHAPLYPPGQELIYEHYPVKRWAAAMDNHGSVYYGHIHTPHGIYTADGVTFCNPGALSRGSLHEYNLHRTISVAVWDSGTGQFTVLPVPGAKPASEVFRLQEVGEAKTAQIALDNFLASVGSTQVQITSIEAVMEHVRSLNLCPDLTNVVVDLLEGAGHG